VDSLRFSSSVIALWLSFVFLVASSAVTLVLSVVSSAAVVPFKLLSDVFVTEEDSVEMDVLLIFVVLVVTTSGTDNVVNGVTVVVVEFDVANSVTPVFTGEAGPPPVTADDTACTDVDDKVDTDAAVATVCTVDVTNGVTVAASVTGVGTLMFSDDCGGLVTGVVTS